jgi:hypothetical protein
LNAYKVAHGLGDTNLLAIGDLDHSGAVTNADIQSLLNLIASGAGIVQSVPEPTARFCYDLWQ